MLPCGTPCESLNVSDKVDPTRTWIDRSARKLSKKFANLPLTPSSCRSRKIPYFQVVQVHFESEQFAVKINTIFLTESN